MTKGTTVQNSDKMLTSGKIDVGQVLREVLQTARDDNRLTCGLYESGLMLEMNPDSVMACVLPVDKCDDVTLDIHFTLIEAFCLENSIRLVKVDNSEKLEKLLGDRTRAKPKVPESPVDLLYNLNNVYSMDGTVTGDWRSGAVDYNCVLLEYPPSKCSEMEEELLHYHKETCVQEPPPVILLDV